MQKIKKFFVSLLIAMVLLFMLSNIPGFADYGDFESHDSGSDWDSGSSLDSSDDYSYSSGGYYSSGSSSGFGAFLFFLIIVFVIIVLSKKYGKNGGVSSYMRTLNNTPRNGPNPFNVNENEIESKIQAIDPLFNKTEFLSWASDLFVKLQYAWSDRDLETIRSFETPELYEQTASQVQRYINNKQINKMERVSVNIAKLNKFEQLADRDSLTVVLESKMVDYIIDENTGNVLKGDKNLNRVNWYVLNFVRKTGVKTNAEGKVTNTMNCPNCGAATEITSSGKCPYCGSIITTRDHNWSLASLKRYNPNM